LWEYKKGMEELEILMIINSPFKPYPAIILMAKPQNKSHLFVNYF
jgi:hypothetical protein